MGDSKTCSGARAGHYAGEVGERKRLGCEPIIYKLGSQHSKGRAPISSGMSAFSSLETWEVMPASEWEGHPQ